MSNAMKFKATVVNKVLEDIIKYIPVVDPATETIETNKLYKVINGRYVKEGKEIPHDVLTQSFMNALHETCEAVEHLKEIAPGIKIADKPAYEETVDPETHDVKRKIRIVFLLPKEEEVKPIKPETFVGFRKGKNVLFNKDTNAFVFGDNNPVSMADAVFFANCVICTLTNRGGMFVSENMKPEFIDMYNKSFEE